MTKRIKMTVEMDVTVPQGLALQAMFKMWNRLASVGSSRMVAFYVDGDGNFKPKCSVSFSEEVPELTEELEKVACILNDQNPGHGDRQYQFDFDGIAWKLSAPKPLTAEELKITDEIFGTLSVATAQYASDKDTPLKLRDEETDLRSRVHPEGCTEGNWCEYKADDQDQPQCRGD